MHSSDQSTPLEQYFLPFRNNIIGIDAAFESPYGMKKLVYADWIASGRLYGPIEDQLRNRFGPMVGNTHSESTETGNCMTQAYHLAHQAQLSLKSSNTDTLQTTL